MKTRIYKIVFLLFLGIISGSTYGQNVLTESFDGTTFVPSGWAQGIVSLSTSRTWNRVTSSTSPTCSPNSGAGMARYNSFSYSSGSSAYLRTANIDMSTRGTNNATVSFYFFRDVSAYTTTTYSDEGITVWVSTSSSSYTTGSNLGFVPRAGNYSATGMASGAATSTATQWIKYTYNLPSAYSTSANYVYFVAVSRFGNRMTLDDVSSDIIAPCTDPPTAGTTVSTTSSACASTSFTLSISGNTSGTGQTYQWQSSSNNTTWTNVSGATNTTLTITQSTATYYQCMLTCGSNSAASASVYVTQNSFLTCYCTSSATSTADEDIFNVTFGSLNNTSTCSTTGGTGSVLNMYSNFTSITAPTVAPGDNVSFSVQIGTCGGNYTNRFAIFIDWNQDGDFTDTDENPFISTATSGPNTQTGTIVVPLTAVTGTTRMRVVCVETSGTISSCGTYSWGETEDYYVTVAASTACIDPPTAGTASTSSSNVCASTSFTLSITGNTSGSGQTYQWQSSPNNSTWTNITGATNQSLSTTQSSTTYYQCVLTCGANSATTTSVVVTQNSFLNCYCTSSATSAADEDIFNVTFGSLNNTSTCSTTGGTGSVLNMYSNYTSVTAPNVSQGDLVSFSVQIGTCGGNYTNRVAIFIDFNQDGDFTDTDENPFISTATSGPNTQTGSIQVPLTATTGTTRMRVVSVETSGTISSCGTYTWGETEDYYVNITLAGSCIDPPTAGTASTSLSNVCASTSFTISITGNTSGSGQTYQWQSSPNNSTWTNITGATNQFLSTTQSSTTYYQCVLTCGANSATTTSVVVTQNSFLNCYCTSSATSAADEDIFNVTFGSLNNTSDCSTTGGGSSVLNMYSDFTSVSAPTVSPGDYVPFSVQIGTCGGNFTNRFAIFIDWNQDGDFTDTDENPFISTATSGPNTQTGSVLVPLTALLGTTMMRVVNVETSGTISSCGTYTWGETEDYLVELIAATPCIDPPTAGIAETSDANVCSATSFTLTISGNTSGSGQTYQWQSSPDGITYTNISGATNLFYTTTQTDTTYYQCILTCGSNSSTTTPVVVYQDPFYNCYCIPTSAGGACVTEVSMNTLFNSTSTSCTSPAYGSYSATTDLYQGDNVTLSVTTMAGAIISVWIDFDQDGIYEATEWTQVTTTSTANVASSVTVSIPVTATLGQTGMRVRSRLTGNINGSGDACTAFGSGECEDFVVNILTTPTCTTTVVGGTASGQTVVTAGPPSNTYTLSGYTGNIQWQGSSTSSSGPWTNISGATNASQSLTANAPGTVYLRAFVTSPGCPSDSSNVLTITVNSRTGDSQTNPIQVGTLTSAYSDTQSNATGSGFTNDYTGANNQANADIFYRFTTGPCIDSITVSLCGASFDTYLHLLDSTGTQLVGNDDNGPLCTGLQSSIVSAVTPNTVYYVVTEGFSSNSGNLPVVITPFDNNPLSAPSISGPSGPQCASVNLSASPAFASYSWSTGGTGSSETVNASGNVTVIGIDANGCNSPASSPFTADIVTPPVADAGVDVNVCTNVSAAINASPISNAYTGMWTVVSGNGNFANPTNNNTLVSNLLQTNVYQWTVSDVGNICPSAFDQVTINSIPRPTNLTSANATATTVDVSWSAPVNPDSFLIRYQENCTGANYYAWVSGTLRTATLTGLNPCATYCFRVRSQCTNAPLPQYSATNGSFTTSAGASCVAVSNVAIANSSACNYTVSWSNCVLADSFRVRYKLSSASVWSFSPWTASYSATVPMGPGSWMVRVQSKCGTTIYSTGTTNYTISSCRTSGVSEELVSNLVLFPNPATERSLLNFTSIAEGDYAITVKDISGRTLRTISGTAVAGENTAEINVNGLSIGLYLVGLTLNGETRQVKLTVE